MFLEMVEAQIIHKWFRETNAIIAVQSDGILTKWSAATNEHPVEQTIPTLGWITFLETKKPHIGLCIVGLCSLIYLLISQSRYS
jgi:hypothetical protein